MATPRKQLIDLSATPYYHCISRCVRRAYLCGEDRHTGENFDHRKIWLVEKMKVLTEFFAIEICAYAVMSNHYHLVLSVNQDKALKWSAIEVLKRWAELFPMSKAAKLFEAGVSESQLKNYQPEVETWRKQLFNISWFMRALNESIARQANKEDGCKGRFWESRFKSQALLDDSALLACMTYVELNPIRAKLAHTPEDSDFTSIQERIRAYKHGIQPTSLSQLATPQNKSALLPIDLETYFTLVDQSGRIIRAEKKGSIPEALKPLLQRLNIEPKTWGSTITNIENLFESFIGKPSSIQKIKAYKKRARGINQSRKTFNAAA